MFEYKEYILIFKKQSTIDEALELVNRHCDEFMIFLSEDSDDIVQISTDLTFEELQEWGKEYSFLTLDDRTVGFHIMRYKHQKTLDGILDKILEKGYNSLSSKEFRSLREISSKI